MQTTKIQKKIANILYKTELYKFDMKQTKSNPETCFHNFNFGKRQKNTVELKDKTSAPFEMGNIFMFLYLV